jgi:glutathione S-transferase
MTSLKLFEFELSRSTRVRWALQELGVAFEAVTIDLFAGDHRRPEFLKINPAGRVPVLMDGDMVLTESVAIVRYLAEKYPEKRLIPTNPLERTQLDRWLLFTATELDQPLWRIHRHMFVYPPDKRLPAEIAIARDDFSKMARVIEVHLRGR